MQFSETQKKKYFRNFGGFYLTKAKNSSLKIECPFLGKRNVFFPETFVPPSLDDQYYFNYVDKALDIYDKYGNYNLRF